MGCATKKYNLKQIRLKKGFKRATKNAIKIVTKNALEKHKNTTKSEKKSDNKIEYLKN